jgi:hypothetical protein
VANFNNFQSIAEFSKSTDVQIVLGTANAWYEDNPKVKVLWLIVSHQTETSEDLLLLTTDPSLEAFRSCKATSSEINEMDNDITVSHTIKEGDTITSTLNELSDRSKTKMLCQEREPQNINMLTVSVVLKTV